MEIIQFIGENFDVLCISLFIPVGLLCVRAIIARFANVISSSESDFLFFWVAFDFVSIFFHEEGKFAFGLYFIIGFILALIALRFQRRLDELHLKKMLENLSEKTDLKTHCEVVLQEASLSSLSFIKTAIPRLALCWGFVVLLTGLNFYYLKGIL